MNEPGEVLGVAQHADGSLQARFSIWQRLKGFGVKKLFLTCVAIGVGLGLGVVGTAASINWFFSRPIPARDWPRLDLESAGLKAKLKTDWNDFVRYQLVVTPQSDELKAVFDDTVRSHRDSISFTLHLYDKAGFELCKEDVKPTPFVDAGGRVGGLHANGIFHSFECSRSDYKEANQWNLSYVFPALTSAWPRPASPPQLKTAQSRRQKSVGRPFPTRQGRGMTR